MKQQKEERAAQEISSSPIGGRQNPKQKDQTGPWSDRNNQDKHAVPKIRSNNGALERTVLFPHGIKPFNYRQQSDRDGTELLALGQIIAQQDKKEGNTEGDKSYPGSTRDDEGQDDFLDDLDDLAEDMRFNEEVRSCLGRQ